MELGLNKAEMLLVIWNTINKLCTKIFRAHIYAKHKRECVRIQ